MPTTLSETSSFDAATAPVGTDIRNAASVQSALQAQTNRSRFVFDRTTALADIAALKAIASPADGLVRLVRRFGFYVFDTSSAAAEALPFIVQPTTGTGRWIHELIDVEGNANGLANLDGTARVPIAQLPAAVASGLATLDGTTKLTQAQTRNGIIAVSQVESTGPTTTSTSYVDASGMSLALTCNVGDILVIDAAVMLTNTVGTAASQARVQVVDGTTTTLASLAITRNLNERNDSAIIGRYVVTTGGTVTVKMQFQAGTGATLLLVTGSPLRVTQIRP